MPLTFLQQSSFEPGTLAALSYAPGDEFEQEAIELDWEAVQAQLK